MRYIVFLRFTITDTTPCLTPILKDFMVTMPHLWIPLTKTDLEYTLNAVEQPRLTELVLDMDVVVPAEDITSMSAAMRRLGIKRPEHIRSTTALLLWISSLRRIGLGPLQVAWNVYCKHQGLPISDVPMFIMAHGFKVVEPQS